MVWILDVENNVQLSTLKEADFYDLYALEARR
jgi:hypothetical protein